MKSFAEHKPWTSRSDFTGKLLKLPQAISKQDAPLHRLSPTVLSSKPLNALGVSGAFLEYNTGCHALPTSTPQRYICTDTNHFPYESEDCQVTWGLSMVFQGPQSEIPYVPHSVELPLLGSKISWLVIYFSCQ